MTDTKRSLLSAAGGLLITTTLTIVSFNVESQRGSCILSWPACLLHRWIGPIDPSGREGTPADYFIFIFCLLVGVFISLIIYSFLTYIVLNLIIRSEE